MDTRDSDLGDDSMVSENQEKYQVATEVSLYCNANHHRFV